MTIEKELSIKFKEEIHGDYGSLLVDTFDLSKKEEGQAYRTKVELDDGSIYSGYMKGSKLHGPGTLVTKDYSSRFEGIWVNDDFCTGIGRREFSDGETYKGEFSGGKYQGK